MEKSTYAKDNRVGMFLKLPTRNRLNVFKAQYNAAAGRVAISSQDDAVSALLDHYAATSQDSPHTLTVTA